MHGFLSLFYLFTGIAWMVKCAMHWRDILPIQTYLTGVIVFLMIEQAFSYGFYENINATGEKSRVLAVFVVCTFILNSNRVQAVLNAGRNSLSFFILLIVCLGYGVIRPTLGGNLMRKCKILALSHFVFGVFYSGIHVRLPPINMLQVGRCMWIASRPASS